MVDKQPQSTSKQIQAETGVWQNVPEEAKILLGERHVDK